jgi:hypothetical protein
MDYAAHIGLLVIEGHPDTGAQEGLQVFVLAGGDVVIARGDVFGLHVQGLLFGKQLHKTGVVCNYLRCRLPGNVRGTGGDEDINFFFP